MTVGRPLLLGRPVGHRATVVKMETDIQSRAPAWERGLQFANLARRCGARCRSGRPCRGPAMKNGRCRMYGVASPGAPSGRLNGCYRHGRYTIDYKMMMAETREICRLFGSTYEN